MNIKSEEKHNSKTPYQVATGHTPDISPFIHHKFYDPIYYYDPDEKFPSTKEQLGKWLGPADNTGDAMTYHILTKQNTIITRSTIHPANDTSTLNRQRQGTSHDEGRQALESDLFQNF